MALNLSTVQSLARASSRSRGGGGLAGAATRQMAGALSNTSRGSTGGTSPSNITSKLTSDYETTKGEYGKGLEELAQAAGLFGPGYGAGMEQTALAGANQSLIGRGLGGSTRPMAVSAGLKAQFEDLRRGKLSEALTRMAQYRQGAANIFPTAGTLAGLAGRGGGGGTSFGGGSSMYVPQSERVSYPLGMSPSTNIPRTMTSMGSTTLTNASATSGIGTPDFGLPSGQSTQQEPKFDYTGYSQNIKTAGQGYQRIIGAPEWMQPYNQA